ncbi:hypothetical protein TR66_29985 [Streptomyces sp. WM6391]|nr:hypothetical protein TR66_29985 [Streptomyces sp. WM6391]
MDAVLAGIIRIVGPHPVPVSCLFAAPAACWSARQTVESTFTSQMFRPFASASAWSRVTILAQTPSRCQRRNRSYTRSQGP